MKLREAKQPLLRMHACDLSMDSPFLIRHSGQESRASKLFMRKHAIRNVASIQYLNAMLGEQAELAETSEKRKAKSGN